MRNGVREKSSQTRRAPASSASFEPVFSEGGERSRDHIKIKAEETSRTKLEGETTTTRKGEAKGSVDQNKIDARSGIREKTNSKGVS